MGTTADPVPQRAEDFTVAHLVRWAAGLAAAPRQQPRDLDAARHAINSVATLAPEMSDDEREALAGATASFSGIAPSACPAFFTLVLLARRDFRSLPTPDGLHRWRRRLAGELGLDEPAIDRLPLVTFCAELLNLPPRAEPERTRSLYEGVMRGTYLPGVRIPDLPPEVDPATTPADLLAAYQACKTLCEKVQLAVLPFETSMQEAALDFKYGEREPRPTPRDCSEWVARTLGELDAHLPEAVERVERVRPELLSTLSGWSTTAAFLPQTCAHDAALRYAAEVRRRFDRIIREASGNRDNALVQFRSPVELSLYWGHIADRFEWYDSLFHDLPPARAVTGFLAREANLAAAARKVRAQAAERPSWDRVRRVLRFRDQVIRPRPSKASPNQDKVLGAFERENWEEVVATPLSGRPLKDTVRDLNGSIVTDRPHVCFEQTGEGEVSWTAMPAMK